MNYILILIGFVFGIILDVALAFFSNKNKKRFKINKLRIHHSVLGIIFVIIGFFIYREVLISAGIGIILGHTIRTKEFVFIEKTKKTLKGGIKS